MKWNEYGTSKSSLFNYVCLQRYLREGATGLEYFFSLQSRPYGQVKVSPQAKRMENTDGRKNRPNKLLPLQQLYQPNLELVTHYDLL